MIKFMALLAVVMTLVITTPEAEARKFGGGRSFGKTFKTAPMQKQSTPSQGVGQNQANTAGNKKGMGMMGGLMGGLLAGGLIGALMGGAFEGLQMMDILIFGLLAFVAFKIFKSMSQAKAGATAQASASPQAFAGNGGMPKFQYQTPTSAELSDSTEDKPLASNIPHNLPDGFDQEAFIKGSLDHYRTLQEAWNIGNFSIIQEYVSEQIYQYLVDERATLPGDQHTQVLFLDAQIVRANTTGQTAELSLQFSGRYSDTQDNIEEDINDVWHLERDISQANSPWLIVGMQ